MSTNLGGRRKIEQTPKKCLWCEEIIEIGTRSPAQYNKIQLHKDCVTSYGHYKCSKSKADVKTARGDSYCAADFCGKLLVRRADEHLQSWEKRKFCSKSCASRQSNNSTRVRRQSTPTAIEIRSGVKRYVRGTPEFERLAQHYLERGF